jgi:ubiquinone/menaquinone biosynthesis C-methylase UbiE
MTTTTHVPDAFDEVASSYDLMVALSPGYHEQLRRSADALVDALPSRRPTPERPLRVLDLGCGSGASTRALEDALLARGHDPAALEVVGVDGSEGMLAQARRKAWRTGVTFRQADAEVVSPAELLGEAGDPFDGVLAAYLFRNVAGRDRLLGLLREVLAPGGVLAVHEYAVRGDRRAEVVWHLVCWGAIIPLGVLTAPRSGIYRYLWRSVLRFDSVVGFRDAMSAAGYSDVRSRTFGGLQPGVLHTFLGTAR